MGDPVRDWRLLSIVVLGLVVLIFIANMHLEVRSEVEDVDIFSRFVHSALVSFMVVSGILFLLTMALSHNHARLVEQALGTFLAAAAGAFVYGSVVDDGFVVAVIGSDVWTQFSTGALRMLVSDFAIVLAGCISFGLLLTLVTGREVSPDPLLELESTSFVIDAKGDDESKSYDSATDDEGI